MPSLDSTFHELRRRLKNLDRMNAAQTDPFYHFVHAADDTARLMENIRRWKTALQNEDNWNVRVVSLAEVMWRTIDEAGRWDEWLELEGDEKPAAIYKAVADTLATKVNLGQQGLGRAILDVVGDRTPNRLVLLTDASLLHPFFRVRWIEELVHDRVFAPTVLFYPGTRTSEFGLRFLGFYKEDPNYRSSIVGGER